MNFRSIGNISTKWLQIQVSFAKNAGSLLLPTSRTFLADYPRQRNRGENRAHLPRRDNYFEQPSLSLSP